MQKSNKSVAALAGLAMMAVAGAAQAAPSVVTANAYGLSASGQLVKLNLLLGRLLGEVKVGQISGYVGGDTRLIGMDVRASNGKLYGVGDKGGIYTIDTKSAVLSYVGVLSVLPSGSRFGVDFNPAADRLRIVSDNGQNLRHNVDLATGGTLTDTPLNTATAPAQFATAPAVSGVVAAAYTNNDVDPDTGTSLFVLNSSSDSIQLQSPANLGTLAGAGLLGLDVDDAGFDIYSRQSASGTLNVGYAVMAPGKVPGLYEVNLLDGSVQAIADLRNKLVDVAFVAAPGLPSLSK